MILLLCTDRNKKNHVNTIRFAMKMNKYLNMILFHSINRSITKILFSIY